MNNDAKLIDMNDNIDFYKELYSHNNFENIILNETNKKECLITRQELKENSVRLPCNHSFNYDSIFLDILNQKYNKNFLNLESEKLDFFQIKCPYCRTKHDILLPYIEGKLKIYKINSYDVEYSLPTVNNINDIYHFTLGNCCYEIKDIITNTVEICKCKYGYVNTLDDLFYCYKHLKTKNEISDYINKTKILNEKHELFKAQVKKVEEAKKAKEEAKKVKEEAKKAKEEAKKAKEEAKKAKEEAKKAKEEAKKEKNDDIDVSLLTCNSILKYGNNKGSKCNCKIYNDNLCKKHYTIINKNIIDVI
jgi:hypothetical protein